MTNKRYQVKYHTLANTFGWHIHIFLTLKNAKAFIARRGDKIRDVSIKVVYLDTTLFSDIFHN